MMKTTAVLAAILLAAAVGSCAGSGGPAPVPRRTAYPRTALTDTLYIKAKDTPVSIDVNADASTATERRRDGSVWLTANYPRYKAKILCTFTPVSDATVHDVVDNRTERMRLNAGGAIEHIEELLTPGGYYATMVKGQAASATPVQFIAVKKEHPEWVVSGAAYFPDNNPAMPSDSLAPIVDDIYANAKRMMLSLFDL